MARATSSSDGEFETPEIDRRPTRFGSGLLTVLAVGTVAVVGSMLGSAVGVAALLGTGVFLAAAVWAGNASHGLLRAASYLVVPIAGFAFVSALGVYVLRSGPLSDPVTVVVNVTLATGIQLAAFGAASSWWGRIGDRDLSTAVWQLRYMTAGLVGFFLLSYYLEAVVEGGSALDMTGADGGSVLQPVFSFLYEPSGAGLAVTTFVFLLAGVLVAVYSLVAVLPIEDLTPREQRASVTRGVRWVTVVAKDGAVLVIVVGTVLGLLSLSPSLDLARTVRRQAPMVLPLATNEGLRSLLVGLLILAGVVSVFTVVVRRVARVSGADAVRRVSRISAALLVGLAVYLGGGARIFELLYTNSGAGMQQTLATMAANVGEQTIGLALALFVLAAFVSLMVVVIVLTGMGFIPRRGAAPAMAASGVFVVGVGAALGGGSAVLVLGTIAVSLVCWDTGAYAIEMGRDVGRYGARVHTELVHVGLVVGLALVSMVVGVLLVRNLGLLDIPLRQAFVVLPSAGVGVSLLLYLLRG
ncbi:MAG: hypothetical protein ABEJ71_00080 [Halodesulfurarchaeum sp.]